MAGEVTTGVRETSQSSICRLMVELETGGNIRLEDGKPSDMWCATPEIAPRSRRHVVSAPAALANCCAAHLCVGPRLALLATCRRSGSALAAGWPRVTTGHVSPQVLIVR